MIIGNGDIASILIDKKDFLFFASGVSNSQETRASEFSREKNLLFAQYDKHKDKRLVYISSLSILYNDNAYTRHKRKMEQYVKMFPNWTIIRLGNIDWGNNPHTIINFFRNQKERGEKPIIQDAFRYVTDLDEFLYWIGMIPDFNIEMNIPGKRLTIKEIYDRYT